MKLDKLRSWWHDGRGEFFTDVLKLTSGTLLGRLLAIAAIPLLTRLYTPEDFKVLAIFTAIVSTLGVVACLRLEIAIPLVESDECAVSLLALSLLALGGFTLLVTAAVVLCPDQIAAGIGTPSFSQWLWLTPPGVALIGGYSVFQFWCSRVGRFGDIARSRVGQVVSGTCTMLTLGWLGIVPLGLLLGNIFNNAAGGITLAIGIWRHEAVKIRQLQFNLLWPTLQRNYRFVVFSAPEALLNVAGVQVPVLLIAADRGSEAGFLFLAMQVMTVPMGLLGRSISQVYMARAAQEYHQGNLTSFTLRIMSRLVVLGTGPLVLGGVLSPIIFPLLFGEEWKRAGEIVTLLVPWMGLQFIASPVSTIMYIVGRQRAMLVLTIIGFFLRVGFVWLAVNFHEVGAVQAFITGSTLYYLTVLLFVLNAANVSKRQASILVLSYFDWRVIVPVILALSIQFLLHKGVGY